MFLYQQKSQPLRCGSGHLGKIYLKHPDSGKGHILFQLLRGLAIPTCFLGTSPETGQPGTSSLDYNCMMIAKCKLSFLWCFFAWLFEQFQESPFSKTVTTCVSVWMTYLYFCGAMMGTHCNRKYISELWDEICPLQLQRLVISEQRSYQHTSK